MEGILLINKPINKTSRDVINELNHIFAIKRIGHTGTLDPIATGVLVCAIGKYTKLVDLITAYDKEYIAEIKLGIKTDTGDITGNTILIKDFNVSLKQVEEVLNSFLGTYLQTVPKYSAVKLNGKKLYEYARENIDVELPKREVTIHKIELLDFTNDIIKFKVHVSKGTYIRSLIEDICEKLDTVGTMQSLIRTKQGSFKLDECYTLDDIKNNNYKLLNIQEFLEYPIIEIDDDILKLVTNGSKIKNTFLIEDKVIFTKENKEIAIYIKEKDILRPYIMF